jgi:death-on-curing protein
MRYLTLSELIYLNGRLLNNDKIMSGKQKVRDLALLEAAVLRPAASAFGADAYPTLPEKVAALLHSIARNHPFTDGNKRTATLAAIFMLQVNGQQVAWSPPEALKVILDVAENRQPQDQLAAWLAHPGLLIDCPPTPDPDATDDMRRIETLITQHDWLLSELAKQ